MNNDNHRTYGRLIFAMLRWGTIVALLALPFTFSDGLASPVLIAGALPVAIAWLAALVMAWRTRNQLWSVLVFLVVVVVPRFIGLDDPGLPGAHAYQWICYLMIFAGLPLLLFRQRMLGISRLNQPMDKDDFSRERTQSSKSKDPGIP